MAKQYANQEFAEEGDVFEAAQQLPPGLPAVHHIRSLDLKLDPAFLAGINASRRGELRILVEAAGAVLAEQAVQINLLPPSHWGGVNSAPELLAAFVRPTDPSIDVILREASDKLAAAGRDEVGSGRNARGRLSDRHRGRKRRNMRSSALG